MEHIEKEANEKRDRITRFLKENKDIFDLSDDDIIESGIMVQPSNDKWKLGQNNPIIEELFKAKLYKILESYINGNSTSS
jgi:hypothetical protein